MRGSKQLLVYVCIVNIPLVKHRGYRTNYLSHHLTDLCGCTYSVLRADPPFFMDLYMPCFLLIIM